MALRGVEPLDEIVWAQPMVLQSLPGGYLHTNSVHWYFYNSPFFDHISNNNAIMNEAKRYPEKAHLLQDRKAFEDAVRTMASGGLQYLIVGEAQAPDAPWIMQKQQRTVRRGQEDEVEVLETYWIIGDRIMIAPSVADALHARFLSMALSLNKFFNMASELDIYTPATGHSYLPPSYKPPKKAGPGAPSRATSPGPIADESSQLPTGSQSVTGAPSAAKVAESRFPDNFFINSLLLTQKYQNEYADENPLLGEPGSFVFSSTTERVAAQNAAQAAAHQKAQESQSAVSDSTNATKTPGGSQLKSFDGELSTAAPTPKPPSAPGSRKGSVAKLPKNKEGRRKSKATTSPTSPTG